MTAIALHDGLKYFLKLATRMVPFHYAALRNETVLLAFRCRHLGKLRRIFECWCLPSTLISKSQSEQNAKKFHGPKSSFSARGNNDRHLIGIAGLLTILPDGLYVLPMNITYVGLRSPIGTQPNDLR